MDADNGLIASSSASRAQIASCSADSGSMSHLDSLISKSRAKLQLFFQLCKSNNAKLLKIVP
jgi:hypothetical protein